MGKEWDAPWKYGMSEHGFSDGADRRPAPSFTSSRNPTCQACGLRQRTWAGGPEACSCDEPDFDATIHNITDRQKFQAWCHVWLTEVHRVLPSGGVVKIFGGTRMFHRMAQAMAEAGFVDIGLEAWCFGCLSDDTEILTEHGWKLGILVEEGERVACWDPATEEIRLEVVEQVTVVPFEGEMVVFRNDNTDQLLTPNHRIYKRHRIREMKDGIRVSTVEPDWTVEQASAINRWNPLKLPLAGLHDGPGAGGEDWVRLLGWVWTEGCFDQSGTGVRIYQSSVNMEHVEEIQALLDKLVPGHKCYTRERTYKDRAYTEYCWFFSGEIATRVRGVMPEKRPTWALLWDMRLAEKRVFVDAALKGDGTCGGGRWAFYQKHPDDLVWFQTLAHLMNRQGRINFNKRVVGLHMNPTTELQGKQLKAAETEFYQGDVWCVRVPTGAFLARRNDQVFITGNSGFPKSLNVSKAIDKHLGKDGERPVVGTTRGVSVEDDQGFGGIARGAVGVKQTPTDIEVTAGASEEAQRFDGWGTALKPAWEPFLVGYKP